MTGGASGYWICLARSGAIIWTCGVGIIASSA